MADPIGTEGPQIKNWFSKPGAYVLVDGQYGSTGKGLFAAYIAFRAQNKPTIVTTNQGPNSGHTAIWLDPSDREIKVITKQLPMASVIYSMLQEPVQTYLNAGAIIDPRRLAEEGNLWDVRPLIHPKAAIVTEPNRQADQATVGNIASTGQGTGPALISKISRSPEALVADDIFPVTPHMSLGSPTSGRSWDNFWKDTDRVFVETAQGFSLGLNSCFYPHVTSRECTVMQAITDARIPAQMVRRVAMCVRTFPIRVGNVGPTSSGDAYPDQKEITWDALGVDPELTTVTRRIRRVFTWSRMQFRDAVAANRPDVLFINFMNYLSESARGPFINEMFDDYMLVMGRMPTCYYGFGPRVEDIRERYW